jgi:hypothetical protein
MKHILNRNSYLNENLEDSEYLDDLDVLKQFGLLNQREYLIAAKKLGDKQQIIEEILASDQMARLKQLGFNLDSGAQQLKNGTIVIKIPGKSRRLGIFPNGILRRMYLNTEDLGGAAPGMDLKIKKFDGSGVEMYLQAMDWIINNIDFTSDELVTKKALASKESAMVKKLEVIEKIRSEFKNFGFNDLEVDKVMEDINPWSVTDAKSYLSEIKKWLKQGIFPYYGHFSSGYAREETDRINSILSTPGIKWIKLQNRTMLSVFLNSRSIWDNFDLDAQTRLIFGGGFHQSFNVLTIRFESESQVEEYAPIFNNYETTNGVEIVHKSKNLNAPDNWMFS